MAHYLELDERARKRQPVILVVATGKSWRRREWRMLDRAGVDYQIVDLGEVAGPRTNASRRNTLVNLLSLAIYRAKRPVVLVARGLGCVVAAWWAEYERPAYANPVLGAVLIEPPDIDRPGSDDGLAQLGSCPRGPWPFPSFLVSDLAHDDAVRRTHRMLAMDWGSRLAGVASPAAMTRSCAPGRTPVPEAGLIARLMQEGGMGVGILSNVGTASPPVQSRTRRSVLQRIGDAVSQIAAEQIAADR